MKNVQIGLFFLALSLSSCAQKDSEVEAAFEVYCEMVANGAKAMGLHYPMEFEAVDDLWPTFLEIAQKYEVELYREDAFPDSDLFPADLTQGKTIVLIYRGARLKQYQQWKADVEAKQDHKDSEALARRLGRLLGYSSSGINRLLRKHSDYRNLASFGLKEQISHLYYENIEEAHDFYKDILGLRLRANHQFQISKDAFIELHTLNEAHPQGQAKSTAIALLTDHLAEAYAYLQEKEVPIKYGYQAREGGPHDGFVAIDPGGYLLEFEQFKQDPENELFMAVLEPLERIESEVDGLNFYASITWTYHKDLLKMQAFYEEVLGFHLVADQGWTKIYQTSPSGFIGLVDEVRGMEDYADTKALEIEWKLSELEPFDEYARKSWQSYSYQDRSFLGPENYQYRLDKMN